MSFHAGLPRRFAKHVVQRTPLPAPMPAPNAASLAPLDLVKRDFDLINTENSSSLQPLYVIVIVGGLCALFLLLISIGGICKLTNRPRSEARHRVHSQAMFQPSAAGYGARKGGAPVPIDAPVTNLLDAASPMGMGGNSVYEQSSPDVSMDAAPSHLRGHTRGKSSGVHLPGPPAAFRRGAQPQHPRLENGMPPNGTMAGPGFSDYPSAAPDGSGFRPGSTVGYGQRNSIAPRGLSDVFHIGHASQPSRSVNRGPPPALSRSRSGRYAQGSNIVRKSRIDSVGPGTYRKSMFLPENGMDGAQRQPGQGEGVSAGGLRRVDSIGKGQSRKSSYGMRGPSVYGMNLGPGSLAPLDIRKAREDGWGSGQRSPGLSTPGASTPSNMGPLGMRNYGDGSSHDYSAVDPYSNDPYAAYNTMQTGYSATDGHSHGGMYPRGGMQAVEGVGGGGGRRII
ncbi:hypothetical protein ACQY0O_000896 [Thecaphora frezii]